MKSDYDCVAEGVLNQSNFFEQSMEAFRCYLSYW